MAGSKMWAKVGVWAYVVGIVIAVLVAIFAQLETWSIAVLAVLGIIVGLLNITDKEVKLFLIASIAFVVAASQMGIVFNAVSYFFGRDTLVRLTQAIVVFTAPGALVVAFKALYHVAKSE
jgi:hypothetical protein